MVQRLELIIDLRDSEKKYLQDLSELRKAMYVKLQAVLPDEQLRVLFDPLLRFPQAHEYLSNVLQAKLRAWKPHAPFVEVFKLWIPNLRLYASYPAERSAALALLDSLSTPGNAKSFRKSLKSSRFLQALNSCTYLDLVGSQGYARAASLPAKRIEFYANFLAQYHSLLDKDHVDFPLLPELIEQMTVAERALSGRKWVKHSMIATNTDLLQEHILAPQAPALAAAPAQDDRAGEAGSDPTVVDTGILAFLLNTPHKLRTQPECAYDHEEECAKSILAEPVDDELIMRRPFDRFEVQYGTLNRLVQLLTTSPLSDRAQSQRFALVFFRTFTTFCTPELLLSKLIERFYGVDSVEVQSYTLKTLSFWINFEFERHHDLPCVPEFSAFLGELREKKATLHEKLGPVILFLCKMFQRKTSQVLAAPTPLYTPAALANTPFSPDNFLSTLSPMEIASQLSLVDYETYRTIQIDELLGLAWQDKTCQQRAPHLIQLIARLNKLSSLCTYAVITGSTISTRVKMISRICAVMKALLELQNFSSLIAFSSSLQDASVFRLKKTWAALGPKEQNVISQMKAIFESSSNYQVFRRLYEDCHSPCIPFIGIFLTDLTFTEEGNKDFVKGLVNFHKKMLISDIISAALRHQSTPYKFTPNPQFIAWLENQPLIPSKSLYSLSVIAEPRDS